MGEGVGCATPYCTPYTTKFNAESDGYRLSYQSTKAERLDNEELRNLTDIQKLIRQNKTRRCATKGPIIKPLRRPGMGMSCISSMWVGRVSFISPYETRYSLISTLLNKSKGGDADRKQKS